MADPIGISGPQQLSTGVGGTPAGPGGSTPAKKPSVTGGSTPSVFDAAPKVMKGDGQMHSTGMADYSTNATTRAPVSPPTPGFAQRIRSMVTDGSMPGTDTGQGDMANGIQALTRPGVRQAAVAKVEQEAVSGGKRD